MYPQNDEKQVSVRLSEYFIDRLDKLAKNGSVNRHHLMLCLIIIWLKVLEYSKLPNYFKLAIEIRDLEARLKGDMKPPLEYIESKFPEKSIPVKLTDADIKRIACLVSRTHLSRHQLLINMMNIGIEELENATSSEVYRYADIEPQLYSSLETIMKKGRKAFLTVIKGRL